MEKAIAGNPRAIGPAIVAEAGRVSVASGAAARPATVWLVSYDPRPVQLAIGSGENRGRKLPHRNVVRQLALLGVWTGKAVSHDTPARPAGLDRAVQVQVGSGGFIAAASRILLFLLCFQRVQPRL